jgi:hypothetical protein
LLGLVSFFNKKYLIMRLRKFILANFIIAMARWSGRKPNYALSVNIGFLVNAEFKKRVKFWADPTVPSKTVNITCERCSLADCADRVAPATQLIKQEEIKKVESIIEGLMKG